jgi:hypothetical protein
MPDPSFRDKLNSIHFNTTKTLFKTTTDDHETHKVHVTESDDRQDVKVELPTINHHVKGTVN